jgi:hypothetical protein
VLAGGPGGLQALEGTMTQQPGQDVAAPAEAEAPPEDAWTVTHHWRPAGHRGAWRDTTVPQLGRDDALAFIQDTEHA